MSNLLDNPGLWTVLGVLVGLLGGEGVRILRERRAIKKIKSDIRDELISIKGQIPFQISIIDKCLGFLEKGQTLPMVRVRHVTTGYYSSITRIYNHLTVIQRNCLHVIYEKLRITDETLDNFERDLMFDYTILKEEPANLLGKFKGKLRDLRKQYPEIIDLINSYLDNKPIDVYEVEPEVTATS